MLILKRKLGTADMRSKGEITIPKEARKYLGIKPGDRISLWWEDGKLTIKREKTTDEDFQPQSEELGT